MYRSQNIRNLSAVLFVTATLSGYVRANTPVEGERHVESAGGFSYIAPKGWVFAPTPGMKFTIATGPVANQFMPNINVVDEASAMSLQDYAKANVRAMTQVFKNFKLISQDDFKTTSGVPCVRLVVEDSQLNHALRQRFYLFDSGTTKFVVTGTSLAQDKSLDDMFDAALKTWQFEKKSS